MGTTKVSVAEMIAAYLSTLFLFTAVHKKKDIVSHIEKKGYLKLPIAEFTDVSDEETKMVVENTDYKSTFTLKWQPCSQASSCLNYVLTAIIPNAK